MKTIVPSSQSVKQIFNNNYVIPKYQRKYTWKEEQCRQLWEDLLMFHEDWPKKAKKEEEYFLGNIIINKLGSNKPAEVIDGQQRLITLSLLIKALLEEFVNGYKSDRDQSNMMMSKVVDLKKCLFIPDPNTDEIPMRSKLKLRLNSEVIEEDDHNFTRIIKEDYKIIQEEVEKESRKKRDSMMKNYGFFIKEIKNWANGGSHGDYDYGGRKSPRDYKALLTMLMNNVRILKIESESINDAIDVFQTINDRGSQLDDTDILKAKIIPGKNKKDQKEFVERWNKIEDLQNVFNIYMHIIRAEEGIYENTTEKIRTFFPTNKVAKQYLKDWRSVLETIEKINDITKVMSGDMGDIGGYIKARWKILEKCYPRRRGTPYWQLPLYVFLHKRINKRDKDNNLVMDKQTIKELKKLTQVTLRFFAIVGTCYSNERTRSSAYQTCAAIVGKHREKKYKNGKYLDIYNERIKAEYDNFKRTYEEGNFGNYKKLIVFLGAYLNQKQSPADFIRLLDEKHSIEHILPKNWKVYEGKFRDAKSAGWKSEEEHREDVEKIGNLIPLEHWYNSSIKHHTFDEKKKAYKESRCQEAKKLAQKSQKWNPNELEKRDKRIQKRILQFLRKD